MEEKKYPIGGFAPGNYTCKCCICKQEFQGDKRAVQCEPCAVKSVGGLPPLTEPILTDEDVKNCEATINHDRVIANQVAGMPWEEAIFQDGYSAGVEFEKKRAKPGAVWVKASEYDSTRGGVLFYRFLGPTLKSCGTGNFSGGVFHGLIGDHFPKNEWEYLYILDESPAVGREEHAVAFHDWVEKYRSEYDFREQRTHTTAELYKLFKQQKEK